MNKKGFTITELLAVIAIIAILSIAAISGYSTMSKNSKEKSLSSKISTIENAAYKYANENNISKQTTISVNKLVVLGYLQADESSDEGLSVYKNPVTGENMICNLIDLSISNNEVVVKYNKNKKDCNLSNEELDSAKIKVTGYCVESPSSTIALRGDTFDWVNCNKVFIRTNPNGIAASNVQSIAFDYDGNSVVNKTGTITTNNVTTTDGYRNVTGVDGVDGQVLTTDIGITYTMNDGKIYYRHVLVRIDKQKPTITYVLRNDTALNETDNSSTRKIEIYVDDANGSGSKGFYLTRGTSLTGATINTTSYKKTISAELGEWYLTPIDNVDNKGTPEKIRLENVPGKLGCTMELYKQNKTTKVARTNNWYNHSLWVKQLSPSYNNGVSYDILKGVAVTNRGQLKQYANRDQAVAYFYPTLQTEDMYITDFNGGLWNVQNKSIKTCQVKAGIDTESPVVSVSQNSNSKHQQKHSVTVTITDVSNAAKHNVISGFYTSGTTYTLRYAWAKVGVTPSVWKSKTMTVVNSKTLSATIEDRKDVNDAWMTGGYKLWIMAGSVQDLALNNNKPYTTEEFKLDNTSPSCVSSGGITSWVNYNITLYGTCGDQVGTTDQSGCVSNISRVQSAEINSSTETPGTVYDKAGNSTLCPQNQHAHIDKTGPNCIVTKDPNVTWTNKSTNVYGTCQDKGTYQSGCKLNAAGTSVDTGANTVKQTSPSPGSVTDNAGNTTPCGTIGVNIDKIPPTCTPGSYIKDNAGNYTVAVSGWTNHSVKVKGVCSDSNSGCANSNTTSVLHTPIKTDAFTSNTNDNYSPPGTIYDSAGNSNTCGSSSVQIDKTDPGCSISRSGSTGYWSCSDSGGSGLKGDSSGSKSLSGSSCTVSHTCKDHAGNENECSKTFKYYADADACGTTPRECGSTTCDNVSMGACSSSNWHCYDGSCSSTAGCCNIYHQKTCYDPKSCWHG